MHQKVELPRNDFENYWLVIRTGDVATHALLSQYPELWEDLMMYSRSIMEEAREREREKE